MSITERFRNSDRASSMLNSGVVDLAKDPFSAGPSFLVPKALAERI